MSDENIDLLCESCGETFSDFLHQMADQNAKVATCPKCGKIHDTTPTDESNSLEEKPVAEPAEGKKH